MHIKFTSSILWILAALLTAGAGVLAGSFNNRWGVAAELEAAGSQLANLSKTIGQWEMLSSQSVGRGTQAMLQCTGSIVRVYRNRDTGQVVSMALLVGPPGPISVHTPEICFSSREYTQLGPREAFQIANLQRSDEGFWGLQFRKNDLHSELLRVVYAWSDGNGWVAPNEPRFSFAGERMLYKIQLAAPIAETSKASDPCRDFLRDLLPVLNKELVAVGS
jgi:hypothetical protein